MKSTTKSTFNNDVTNSKKTVLLDVWAPWCAPCRGMNTIIDQLAEELKDTVEVVKLDASAEMGFAQELGITGLPTFMIYKNGKIVSSSTGMASKENIKKMLD